MSAQRFKSKKEVMSIAAPTAKDFIEVRHVTQAGFYVRIMKPDQVGRVRRSWVCRYSNQLPDGKGGYRAQEKKEVLGLVEKIEPADSVMSLEEALASVLEIRRGLQKQKISGGTTPRLTIAAAWGYYSTEKHLNRDPTQEKDQANYEHYLPHLKNRFLDELNYGFWSQFVQALRDGSLVVGTVTAEDGVQVPDLRGPIARATLHGVMSTVVTLYKIAHKYRGLQGFQPGENPAAEAKALIGRPNKRKGMLPLDKLGHAWLASDAVTSPWWRDLFRMAILTGLRRSLLYSMRFDEIDFETGTIHIHPLKPGTKKRGKDFGDEPELIKIPLSKTALEIIKNRRMFAPDKAGPVWYAPKSGRGARGKNKILSDHRSAWQLITNAADAPEVGPHDCRRTFATVGCVAVQGNLISVALLLMHSAGSLARAAGLPEITVDYINTDEAQGMMRESANAISDYIANLARKAAAEVKVTIKTPDVLPIDIEVALGVDE